ncbi:hypothetical protein [Flavobacterium caeni]|uniref:Uncharacterized protein n=1 Tax=Flavobacterium caeni TaxID=490189 RepID=A0A1G5GD33_9FLAO|nr:hypothetical protein [Flavobacterium caeni]SCY49453.1 hypothetical protein SAMN02927903_01532 [Flavobacterium caeni]
MNDKAFSTNFLIRLLWCLGFVLLASYLVRAYAPNDTKQTARKNNTFLTR